ncbi:hypothetical protein GQ593_13085 [Gilliamella sp. Pas-s25]|nr:hypothetical protein [Gilliamella sp. Pas-s25]
MKVKFPPNNQWGSCLLFFRACSQALKPTCPLSCNDNWATDIKSYLIKPASSVPYNKNNQLIARYERDSVGRLVQKILPDGNIEHYEYDTIGLLIAVKDN